MGAQSRSSVKALPYRGEITGLVGRGGHLLFVTQHAEGQPTALHRVEVGKAALETWALPTGALALHAGPDALFIAGENGQLFKAPLDGGTPASLGTPLDPAPVGICHLASDRLAVVSGASVVVLAADGAQLQRLDLPAAGTAIAAHADGRFFVVGTQKGEICVFQNEEQADYIGAASARLHEGAVTLLHFEPESLNFLSAGRDGRLLLTHARGKLEPEDRGKGRTGHDGVPRAVVDGEGERFYTVGEDAQLKAWSREKGNRRAQTQKDGVGRGVALALVEYKGRAHLAVAADDASLRIFVLDGQGKVEQRALVLKDAYAQARTAFAGADVALREGMVDTVAAFGDAKGIALLADRAADDGAVSVRIKATQYLGGSDRADALKPLVRLLRVPAEAVRLAAFEGLRTLKGAGSLEPLNHAIASARSDLAILAVQALGELAAASEPAMARLLEVLSDTTPAARHTAAAVLENLHPSDVPTANLQALASTRSDVRQAALYRLFERGFLGLQQSLTAARIHTADKDADVRRAAFLITICAEPDLAVALRYVDKDIHRQLHELETRGKAEPVKPPKAKRFNIKTLEEAPRRPLLEAMSSRSLDTCVAGARGLASLHDPRAFGTLLQLSTESDESTRVAACRALEKLNDPRALQRLRLMLRDSAAGVRDAAFTAVSKLLEKRPLEAVESGLLAHEEDVRRRALGLLSRRLKRSTPESLADPAWRLLQRALNDSAPAIRSEAFKTALNLQAGGGDGQTLRYVLGSLHADVRREVLTELMAQISAGWAWELLLELFDDPDAGLRAEAFAFAKKKSKGKVYAPLGRGLASAYADVRLLATRTLVEKRHAKSHTLLEQAQTLLVGALEDVDETVRLTALSALEAAGAVDALVQALSSVREDVRARAALELARGGHASAKKTLIALAKAERPTEAEPLAEWRKQVVLSLQGLARLGATDAVALMVEHLQDPDEGVRRAAAEGLAWVTPAKDLAPLKAALRHEDSVVALAAALGLAWLGDASGASILFRAAPKPPASGRRRRARRQPAVEPGVSPGLQLSAALSLDAEDVFLAQLDHPSEAAGRLALRVLMLLEWRENDGVPDRCLAALAAQAPRTRLAAARLLERFADLDGFGERVVELLNERPGDVRPWTLSAEAFGDLGELLAFGNGRLKAQAIEVLSALDADEPEAFEHAFGQLKARETRGIEALRKKAAKRKRGKVVYTEAALQELVFGAYIGLSRLPGWRANELRLTALRRITAQVESGAVPFAAAASAFVQALGDETQPVRVFAFQALERLGYDESLLAASALAVGERRIGALGLAVLARSGGGEVVLQRVLAEHTDGLELDAAEQLAASGDPVAVYGSGLEARSGALRQRSVSVLGESAQVPGEAREALVAGMTARFVDTRLMVLDQLSAVGEARVFEPLLGLLESPDGGTQRRAIEALVRLNDPRGASALLDRIAAQPSTAEATALIRGVDRLGAVDCTDRLLSLYTDKRYREAAGASLLALSGYDQRLGHEPDEEDEGQLPDEAWLKGQRVRDDRILASLIDAAREADGMRLVREALDGARWAKTDVVDAPLAACLRVKDEGTRRAATEVVGWRLRHRGGPADGLVELLAHGDPGTGFLAAEGLALGGRSEGRSTLLSGVELLEDLGDRERAVRALGRLGDPTALDLLLQLANEPGHALQEQAAEAIGHMAASERAEAVFKVLKRLASGDDGIAEHALSGLRYFGTSAAWGIIRDRITDEDWSIREHAAKLLAFDDSPESREVLADRLRLDDDWDVQWAAARSLHRLVGSESLEIDYAILQSALEDWEEPILERLRSRGDPARLIECLPNIQQEAFLEPIQAMLFSWSPAPIEAAVAALATVKTLQVGARILGRAGPEAKAHGGALSTALEGQLGEWATLRRRVDDADGCYEDAEHLSALEARITWLCWACGRVGVGAEVVLGAATLGGSRVAGRVVRKAAVEALAAGLAGGAGLDALAGVASGADAQLRPIASLALRRLSPARAAEVAATVLDDRGALNHLARDNDAVGAVLAEAAGAAAVQGIVLPHLIARADVSALSGVALDAAGVEVSRLGALEALARIGTEAAEETILQVAKDEAVDEALRKAAWRALRRSRRLRHKEAAR